jgi:hypothetical protein
MQFRNSLFTVKDVLQLRRGREILGDDRKAGLAFILINVNFLKIVESRNLYLEEGFNLIIYFFLDPKGNSIKRICLDEAHLLSGFYLAFDGTFKGTFMNCFLATIACRRILI